MGSGHSWGRAAFQGDEKFYNCVCVGGGGAVQHGNTWCHCMHALERVMARELSLN